MKLWIDESDGKSFFLSVQTVKDNEQLSFDWTRKGHRAMIQRLTEENIATPDREPDGEWDTLVIDSQKLVSKEHCVWYDLDDNDIVNGENWLTVKEWPIDENLAEIMRGICHKITANQDKLGDITDQIIELEKLIIREADRLEVELVVE